MVEKKEEWINDLVDKCLTKESEGRVHDSRRDMYYCSILRTQGIHPGSCPYSGLKRVIDVGAGTPRLKAFYLCTRYSMDEYMKK